MAWEIWIQLKAMTPRPGSGWQLLRYRTLGTGWLLQHWLHDCTFNILTFRLYICSRHRLNSILHCVVCQLYTLTECLTTARQAQNYGTFLRPATLSSIGILCQQKCDEISYCFRENPLAKLQDLKWLDEGYLILLTPQSFCHVWICWHVVFSFLGITYILLRALCNTEQNNFFGGLACVNLEVRLEMKLTCNLLESADRERGKVLFPSPPKKREEGPLDCRWKWNNKDQRKCVFPWQTFQPFEYVKSGY